MRSRAKGHCSATISSTWLCVVRLATCQKEASTLIMPIQRHTAFVPDCLNAQVLRLAQVPQSNPRTCQKHRAMTERNLCLLAVEQAQRREARVWHVAIRYSGCGCW